MSLPPDDSFRPVGPAAASQGDHDHETDEEKVLNNQDNWKLEAQAVIDDIKQGVNYAAISEKLSVRLLDTRTYTCYDSYVSFLLQSTNACIHFNLTTKEQLRRTVKLTAAGFEVVGNDHDVDGTENVEERKEDRLTYETPYSLLNEISPGFSRSFGFSLMEKLSQLQSSAQEAGSGGGAHS